MPGGEERILRRRIRTVRETQKITRAMELIAASRIARAQQAIAAAKPYTDRMEEVVAELAATPEAAGHWIFTGGGDRPLVVVLGADRGLSGAFNVSVTRAAEALLHELAAGGAEPAVIGVGRKIVSYFNFRERSMAAALEGITARPAFEDAQAVAQAVSEQVSTGTVSEIYMVSTRFSSVGSQRVDSHRLVPLERPEREATTVFEFEPDPDEILDRLLPRWVEAEVYLAMLESAASFHVAQQRAMKAATDNADELIKTLRRVMNRARQDSITTEIMEIVGGAEALRQGSPDAGSSGRPNIYVFPEAS